MRQEETDPFAQYPSTVISNDEVTMKIYLPDAEKGLYRATRFDWSGVIGSVQYKGHEYFDYWKETHDPMVHEDLTGPVEGFIEPGLGYAEAEPGGKFIRIGVGIIEKEEEDEYDWMKTYKIVDNGKWKIDQGEDWIQFTHEVNSDFGYGYIYTKTIKLKGASFVIEHSLKNTGEKAIETDQFNHNFFIIDGKKSGPGLNISFPYAISTDADLKGYMEIKDRDLYYIKDIPKRDNVYMVLEGYTEDIADHKVTIVNKESGAGVSLSIDKPLYRMVFWTCETTLSPENFIWISVQPGEEENWTSEYTLFVE
ncbi:hypothetical protein ACFLU5_16415 [Bacteroidota bacterium]